MKKFWELIKLALIIIILVIFSMVVADIILKGKLPTPFKFWANWKF